MTPPTPLHQSIMITIIIISIGMMCSHPISIICSTTLAMLYISATTIHYLKHARRYKNTQFFAIYKTPFSHLVKNTLKYRQYITYQSLLKACAHNSDLLISHTPPTVLLIHPSEIVIFYFQEQPPPYKTIISINPQTQRDVMHYIKNLHTKSPIYDTQRLMQMYDAILSNKTIPYF